MFIYRNGRFFVGATSFALPHECLIDTLMPVDTHNGLIIKPIHQEFEISIDFSPDSLGAFGGLSNLVKGWSTPVDIVREEYACGVGWSICYENHGGVYHDLRFDISEPFPDEEGRLLQTCELLTYVKSEEAIRSVIKSGFFMELVSSLEL